VQTTTNVVTSSIGTAVPEMVPVITTAGILNSAIQVAGAEYTFTATFLPESNVITLDSNTPSVFTYAEVADSIGESWSDVTTTSTTESWSDV
jgi:L-rhamnose mutarotase